MEKITKQSPKQVAAAREKLITLLEQTAAYLEAISAPDSLCERTKNLPSSPLLIKRLKRAVKKFWNQQ